MNQKIKFRKKLNLGSKSCHETRWGRRARFGRNGQPVRTTRRRPDTAHHQLPEIRSGTVPEPKLGHWVTEMFYLLSESTSIGRRPLQVPEQSFVFNFKWLLLRVDNN
jgi:hypothetical protein